MVSAEGACAAYYAYGRHLEARRARLAGVGISRGRISHEVSIEHPDTNG